MEELNSCECIYKRQNRFNLELLNKRRDHRISALVNLHQRCKWPIINRHERPSCRERIPERLERVLLDRRVRSDQKATAEYS